MISFINDNPSQPYIQFRYEYFKALEHQQDVIEAVNISSFNKRISEVDSRFVNLKFIDGEKFIFFTNYSSPKSIAFNSHNQIAATFYWSSTNVQIRMKATISKTSYKYNKKYFQERDYKKNALAISSDQSNSADSFKVIKENYEKCLISNDLTICPDFWGGYSFIPYYFEFWKGHESRLNNREAYKKNGDNWEHFILQP